jgi:hypothetical protein
MRYALIDPVLVNRFQKKSGVSIVKRYPFFSVILVRRFGPRTKGIVAQATGAAKS